MIASLPMYDFKELRPAHDALWSAIADRLMAAGITNVPTRLTRDARTSRDVAASGAVVRSGV